MYRLSCAIVFLFVIGTCFADETTPSIENIVEAVSGIPGLESFNASAALPSVENAVKKKCEQNGGPDAYERANKAKDEVVECVKGLINMTALNEEMEQAKPNGELDTVFKKYCGRTPELKQCIENMTRSIEPCFEKKEQENMQIIMNITSALFDFACFKEGDRIALFISAQGPECFIKKQTDLQECMNSTLGSYVPAVSNIADSTNGLTDLKALPSLLFGLKECQDIEKLQVCSVKKLESCTDPTPANIVEALFDFIKKSTPCDGILKESKASAQISERSNSAHNFIASLAITAFMVVSLRYI